MGVSNSNTIVNKLTNHVGVSSVYVLKYLTPMPGFVANLVG